MKPDIKIHFKDAWDADETRTQARKRFDWGGYTKRPFPRYKVDEFMVSKRFFLSAAGAWIAAQYWKDTTCRTSDHKAHHQLSQSLLNRIGMLKQFARKLELERSRFNKDIAEMPNLNSLKIRVDAYTFKGYKGHNGIKPKALCNDGFKQDELEQLPMVRSLGALRGLTAFALQPAECHYANTPKNRAIFKSNVAALEELI